MINIEKRCECFFDDYLIDTEHTTAKRRLHRPVRREPILTLDRPWETNLCNMFSVFYSEGKWRMYYVVNRVGDTLVCYAESEDGIKWVRPNLGLIEFEGSTENNILFNRAEFRRFDFSSFDNMSVFYDENPDCPEGERYKMTCMWLGHEALILLLSPDGIHFNSSRLITTEGEFDSQNRMLWSEYHGKYFTYFRGEHKPKDGTKDIDYSFTDEEAKKLYDPERRLQREPGRATSAFMRDIRVIESPDAVTWSRPKLIDVTGDDFQLYHNVIFTYPRAPHLIIGFPKRYVERKEWTPTFDELSGKEDRETRMKTLARFGLAISDGHFMSSRDGYSFTKFDEAILPPPPENPEAFVYGDGCAIPVLIETKSDIEGADNEYSLIVTEGYRTLRGHNKLVRYSSRLDGFASLYSSEKEETIVTKEFTYLGNDLYMNLSTSARGYVFVTIRSENKEFSSYETFGNSTDKRIRFIDSDAVKSLSGTPVTLEIRLRDADIYSMRFD